MKADDKAQKVTVRLWDLPTRVFHWVLVILVAVSYVSAEEGEMDIHEISGLMILALLLFRVVWGFVGSTSARFSDFLRLPGAVIGYVRALIRRDPPHTAGHNPLGGWVVVAFLVLLLAQAVTGLFSNDDIFFEGPLAYMVTDDVSDSLSGLHHDLFDYTLILIGIHVLAIIGYRVLFKENLVRAMFTGKKAVDAGEATKPLSFRSPLWALALLALAGGGVWWLVQ